MGAQDNHLYWRSMKGGAGWDHPNTVVRGRRMLLSASTRWQVIMGEWSLGGYGTYIRSSTRQLCITGTVTLQKRRFRPMNSTAWDGSIGHTKQSTKRLPGIIAKCASAADCRVAPKASATGQRIGGANIPVNLLTWTTPSWATRVQGREISRLSSWQETQTS